MNSDPEEILGYTRHPASAVWPDLTADEYARLRDNIFSQGQDHPILVTPDKQVLDGWHRLKACAELDFEPKVTICHFTGAEIAKKINGAHQGRRHLTGADIALYAVQTMRAVGAEFAQHGGHRASGQVGHLPQDAQAEATPDRATEPDRDPGESPPPPTIDRRTVADSAGVSERTAGRAIAQAKQMESGEQPDPPDPGKKIESRAKASAKRKRFDPLAEMQQKMEFWQELAESTATDLQTVRAELAAVLAEDEDGRADAIAEVKNNADALASQNAALVEANKKLREERDAALEEARFHKEYASKIEEGLRNLSEGGGCRPRRRCRPCRRRSNRRSAARRSAPG